MLSTVILLIGCLACLAPMVIRRNCDLPRLIFIRLPSEIIPTFEENIPAALHFIRSAILHDRAITPLLTQQQDCGFSGSRQIKRIQ